MPGNIGKASDKIWNGLSNGINSNSMSAIGKVSMGSSELYFGIQLIGAGIGMIAVPEPTFSPVATGIATAAVGVSGII